MAIFNQIRVINPKMFVESTWLDDIVTARVRLLVLRNFFTPEVHEAVVDDLQQCLEQVRVSHYPNGALTTLGPYLVKHTREPENKHHAKCRSRGRVRERRCNTGR